MMHATVGESTMVRAQPLQPLLVSFAMAFLGGALLCDILSYARDSVFWAACSYWLLVAGVTMGVVARLSGLGDFFGDRRLATMAVAKMHFIGNTVVLILSAANLAMRVSDSDGPVSLNLVLLSGVVVLLLTRTGWLGGEMAYRHRVGVIPGGR